MVYVIDEKYGMEMNVYGTVYLNKNVLRVK